jgi:small subunit ribosomal protein S21
VVKIKVRNNESLEQALRRFNRDVLRAGILRELRDRERFTKRSELKRQHNKEKNRKIELERKRN